MPSIKQLILKTTGSNSLDQIPFLYFIDHKIKQLKAQQAKKKIESRKNIDLFEYKDLYSQISYYPHSPILENNFYGNAHVLSKSFDINLYTRIEHGLYFGSIVPYRNLESNTHSIITFSEYRRNFIKEKTDCKVICAGPYIHYADPLFNENYIQKVKIKLGKTLLVFPSHSIPSVHAKFDINNFIKSIQDIQQDFDTVLVCLYWQDIALGYAEIYKAAGFLIVTAGHIADYYFLNRLKTIIQLSDLTISNNIGTHIGYCIHLKKPHCIINSQVIYIAGEDRHAAAAELSIRNKQDEKSLLNAKAQILDLFSNIQFSISKEQHECIQYYFGTPTKP